MNKTTMIYKRFCDKILPVMSTSTIERRRHRRVDLPVQVKFRGAEEALSAPWIVGEAKDVGLAGVYAVVLPPCQLSAGTTVNYSVDIPHEQQKQFPFAHVLGTGWIVRIISHEGGKEVGVAIAFTGDTTALSAVQS